MNETVYISVVIPVWNPGPGIEKCIESLREQTLKSIEIIFVDDLGTDDSVARIQAAMEQDKRIRLIRNKENLGPGASRNAGIEAAQGEYVSFIDPDDYVAKDFYQRLYSRAKADNLDIVKGRILYQREDGSIAPHHEQNDTIRKGLSAGKPPYAIFTYEHHSAIYRREMLMRSGARYGFARRAQDTTFLLRACHAAKSLGLEDEALYYFCERQDSAMHVFSLKSLEQRRFSFEEQVDYLVSALSEDRYAPDYTIGLFMTSLRFYSCYEGSPDAEPALRDYCEGMRQQLLRLPFLDTMKKRCFPVRALVDYHTPLPAVPGFLPWETSPSLEQVAVLNRWADFVLAHPECAGDAAPEMGRIFYRIKKTCEEEMKLEKTAPAAEKALQSAQETMNRLPPSFHQQTAKEGAKKKIAKKMPAWIKKLARFFLKR